MGSSSGSPSAVPPRAGPPPPPPGRPKAFRDTLVIGLLTVAGVIATLIWSGGDSGSASDRPATTEVTPRTQPAAAERQLIAALPAPSGATEQPSAAAGSRAWTLPGGDVRTVSEQWIVAIRAAGFTVDDREQDGGDGETFTIVDPTTEVGVTGSVTRTRDGSVAVTVTS